MKRFLPLWTLSILGAVSLIGLSAATAGAQGQDRGPAPAANAGSGDRGAAGGSPSGGGGATNSGGGGSNSASGGSASSGGGGGNAGGYGGASYGAPRSGSGGSSRAGATGGSGYAVPRGGERSGSGRTSGRDGNGGADRSADGTPGTTVPSYARPRDGKEPVGTAVPRGSVPGSGGGVIVVRGGGYYGGYYDPWWYGPGYVGDYGGYYDPWYGGYPSYGSYSQSTSSYRDDGKLRLKIKPRQAEVYVDGYFAGTVDDFDGVFQRLHLETGAHQITVQAPGYEPLTFGVRITPENTTTYEGELKKTP